MYDCVCACMLIHSERERAGESRDAVEEHGLSFLNVLYININIIYLSLAPPTAYQFLPMNFPVKRIFLGPSWQPQ